MLAKTVAKRWSSPFHVRFEGLSLSVSCAPCIKASIDNEEREGEDVTGCDGRVGIGGRAGCASGLRWVEGYGYDGYFCG